MLMFSMLLTLTMNAATNANSAQVTLNGSFVHAVQRSYVLANQTEALKQAEEHYLQAWQNFMPTLGIAGSDSLGGYSTPSSVSNAGALKLAFSQPLFRGFKSIAILEQSKELIKAQAAAREWAFNQLYLDTAQAYFSLASISRQLEHLQNQVGLYDQRMSEIEAWVKIGRSRASDLSSIKAARALSYAQYIQMEGQFSNSWEIYQFITGISNADSMIMDTNLPDNPPQLSQVLSKLDERADLKSAKSLSFSALKAIDIANSDRLPWADLGITAGNAQLWNSATPWSWNVQLTVTYSLFADTFTQSKIREAQSVSRQTDNAYQYLYQSISRDVRTSYAALMSDIQQIKTYQEAIRYQQDNYRQMEKDYRLGAVKITDVLTALSAYEDAVRALDMLLAAAQLEQLRLNVYSGQFKLPVEIKL